MPYEWRPARSRSCRHSRGSNYAIPGPWSGPWSVTPTVDPTTYAQAASLNPDGSHGPIRCGACHRPVNERGVPVAYANLTFRDIETGKEGRIGDDYDLAVQRIHATAPDRGGR